MSTPVDPARQALDRAEEQAWTGPGPRVIAVDGPSGSGKSTLARRIAALAGAPVVHMDDLYDGWAGLETGVVNLVEGILEPLSRGGEGSAPRYDWAAGRYAASVDVPVPPLLVVEGVGSVARACTPYLTLLVWMEADPDDRLSRVVDRDGEETRDRLVVWRDLEARHHAAEGTRGRADLRVTT